MNCYDGGGSAGIPEDESEQAGWADSDDGGLPWKSEADAEDWKPAEWDEDDAGPEYKFYRRKRDEEDD